MNKHPSIVVYGPKRCEKTRSPRLFADHFGIDPNRVFVGHPPAINLQTGGPMLALLHSKIEAEKLVARIQSVGIAARAVRFADVARDCKIDVMESEDVARLAAFLSEYGTMVRISLGRAMVLHGDVKFSVQWLRECGLKNALIVAPHLSALAAGAEAGHQKIVSMHRPDLIGRLFDLTRAAYKG